MSKNLSPERVELLKTALAAEERMLNGCELIFLGLSDHDDPEVSFISMQAISAIRANHMALDAMVEGLIATKH